jgi:hypothetical protein
VAFGAVSSARNNRVGRERLVVYGDIENPLQGADDMFDRLWAARGGPNACRCAGAARLARRFNRTGLAARDKVAQVRLQQLGAEAGNVGCSDGRDWLTTETGSDVEQADGKSAADAKGSKVPSIRDLVRDCDAEP